MRYRLLGKSGLRISQVATAADWSRPEQECRPIFDAGTRLWQHVRSDRHSEISLPVSRDRVG